MKNDKKIIILFATLFSFLTLFSLGYYFGSRAKNSKTIITTNDVERYIEQNNNFIKLQRDSIEYLTSLNEKLSKQRQKIKIEYIEIYNEIENNNSFEWQNNKTKELLCSIDSNLCLDSITEKEINKGLLLGVVCKKEILICDSTNNNLQKIIVKQESIIKNDSIYKTEINELNIKIAKENEKLNEKNKDLNEKNKKLRKQNIVMKAAIPVVLVLFLII
jgi:hypothetical protein